MITNDQNIVPYHELPTLKGEPNTINGWVLKLDDGREVMVGQSEQRDGVFVTLTAPLEGGKRSELHFRLKTHGAIALLVLLQKVLMDNEIAQIQSTIPEA